MPPEGQIPSYRTAHCDAGHDGPVAQCAFELDVSVGVPDWVELMPAGTFEPRDDRDPWHNSDPNAVIAASRALGMDLPIDYEHQTDYAPENGQPAPAAGWIEELQVRAGAIWGRVKWNAKARDMLASHEYRFLSPTFNFTKKGRQVTRILRAALTNNPALHLTALATMETSDMDKELLKKLGLPEDADETAIAKAFAALLGAQTALATIAKAMKLADDAAAEDIAKAVAEALDADRGDELKTIASAAGLSEDASAADIEKAVATAMKSSTGDGPDPSAFVPRSEFDNLKTQLSDLQTEGAESKATAAVDSAIEEGKVTPANRDWAMAYAKKDPEGFADFVGTAPAVVKSGATTEGKPPKAGAALSPEEKETCRVTGMDEETFKKQRDALIEQETA